MTMHLKDCCYSGSLALMVSHCSVHSSAGKIVEGWLLMNSKALKRIHQPIYPPRLIIGLNSVFSTMSSCTQTCLVIDEQWRLQEAQTLGLFPGFLLLCLWQHLCLFWKRLKLKGYHLYVISLFLWSNMNQNRKKIHQAHTWAKKRKVNHQAYL